MTLDNTVKLTGYITQKPELVYTDYEGDMYRTFLKVQRERSRVDVLPIHMRNFDVGKVTVGALHHVTGMLYTRNIPDGDKMHIELALRVEDISQSIPANAEVNYVRLSGTKIKSAGLRTTPNGIKVCDFILSTEESALTASYIPVVGFWSNAERIGNLKNGDHITVEGNFQSREYTKVIDGVDRIMTTYEVSIRRCVS